MRDLEQLAVSDGSEGDVASGDPVNEPVPYRPVLTDEEREVLRREWVTGLRPSRLAGIENPDRGGSRRANPSRPICRSPPPSHPVRQRRSKQGVPAIGTRPQQGGPILP